MSKEFDEFLDSVRKEDETKTKMKRYHINLLIDSELDIDRVKELFEINCGVVERIKMSEFTSEEGKKHIGTINDDEDE